MTTGGEINLNQISTAITQMKDDARVIVKDGEVVEGKMYKNKTTRWLHQTSTSNQEIWSALKTALSKKYDSSIVSRVMPEEGINTSKPLTARTAKEIIKQAKELKQKSSTKLVPSGPQVKVGDKIFFKPDGVKLKEMIKEANALREKIYAMGGTGNMNPEDARIMMSQLAKAKQAIVHYFGFNQQILPEETSKTQDQLEKDSDSYPLSNLPGEDADMVVALRSMINETNKLLSGENQTEHLLEQAKEMQAKVTKQDGVPTPGDVQKMISQVTKAKQTIVSIFQKKGLLPDNLEPNELLNKQSEIDDLDVKRLSPEERKQVGALRDLITRNTRLLNQFADIKNPRVTIYEPTGPTHMTETQLTDAFLDSKTDVQNKMNDIIPEDLKTGDGKGPLTGNDAKQAMDRIAYNFDQLLKQNPDIRLAFGVLSDVERQTRLVSMLNTSRLKTKDSGQLRIRLNEIISKHVPDEKNITKGKVLGQGSFGVVTEGTFNGKKVVVKELVSTSTSLIKNMQELIQEGSIQGRGQDDPNIPRIIGIYKDSKDVPHVVMELVPGNDVYEVITGTNGQRDTESRAKAGLEMMFGIVRGLVTLHGKNMVHLDLKPENVMLNKNTLQTKLIDYGMSAPPDEVSEDKVCGTPYYISPEVLDQHQKPHFGSDIYALGTMLYEKVLGKLPDKFDGKNFVWDIMDVIRNGDPGDFSESCWLDPNMDKVQDLIKKLWERDPNDRPTAKQLLQAFNGEKITPSGPHEPGLKENEIDVLDILKPDSPLRQGGRDILSGWMA